MKPYHYLPFSPVQEYFNNRFNSAWMIVQDSFERLKGRFKILTTEIDFDLDTTKDIVKACIILHNLCERNNCTFNTEWARGLQNVEATYIQQRRINDRQVTEAQFRRDTIARQLYNEYILNKKLN